MDLNNILKGISFEENTGLLDEDICAMENNIKFSYPVEYKDILKRFNGGYGKIGEFYIDFWTDSDVLAYYEDVDDLQGLILFASDGGGMAFAFKTSDRTIYSIPMDCLEKDYAKKIANNFPDFVEKAYDGKLKY